MTTTKVPVELSSTPGIVDNSNATAITIDSSEQVGINTGSPTAILDVRRGDADGKIAEFHTSTGFGIELGSSQSEAYIEAGSSQALLFNTNTSNERMRITSAGLVGIGTNSPSRLLHLKADDSCLLQLQVGNTTGNCQVLFGDSGTTTAGKILYNHTGNVMSFETNSTEVARFDDAQNFCVGTTNAAPVSNNVQGVSIRSFGELQSSRDGGPTLYLNRKTDSGSIAIFRQGGADVGAIGNNSIRFVVHGTAVNGAGLYFGSAVLLPTNNAGALSDGAVSLGQSNYRYNTVFATSGSINTSDANEKQDIEELSDAEKRVAVAAKSLLRKYRWKSAVAEKGDDARIHFGIIAQDLQDAFTDEGLDAARYGMWCSDTWTDEDTGEERTRLGVRYSELLAFIISAL